MVSSIHFKSGYVLHTGWSFANRFLGLIPARLELRTQVVLRDLMRQKPLDSDGPGIIYALELEGAPYSHLSAAPCLSRSLF